MGKLAESVCEHYDVDSISELFESDEFQSDVMDSVQPAFCRGCGEEYDGCLEPDASGVECPYCHQNKVASIGCIVIGF